MCTMTRSLGAATAGTHSLSGLVVEWARHVYGAGHVLHREGAADVAISDLVTDAGRCNQQTFVREA